MTTRGVAVIATALALIVLGSIISLSIPESPLAWTEHHEAPAPQIQLPTLNEGETTP